jgi:beta-lactam-binding protein with PASTA domain
MMAAISGRSRVLLGFVAAVVLVVTGVAVGVASRRTGPEASSTTSTVPAVADNGETTTTAAPGPDTTVASTTTSAAVASPAPAPAPTTVPTARRPSTRVPSPAPASGSSTVIVPNVAGMRLTQATSVMAGAGLNIGWPSYCDDVVTSQSPAAGARVASGTRVAVELVPCVVPNLVGMRLEAAQAAIEAAKLLIEWPAHCDNLVLGQSPAPGTRVDPGTKVSVQLAPPGTC